MTRTFTITDATPADARTIAAFNMALALESESLRLDPPTVLEGVRAVLSDPTKGRYFVARLTDKEENGGTDGAPGTVIGQLMITLEWSDWRNGPIWWVQSVYVHEEHRRKGIFRALYRHVHDAAAAERIPLIRLYVEQHNAAAQAAYANLGLQSSGYIVLERPLNDSATRVR